ncbi:MAG TPA: helix-turn-helix transcriptional regulator [Clostridium sp.]|uniref:helix-turn-helix domain-containing protein n=1 Tax=Clostridium sp. TaxID=1506 RepID=UPI002F929E3A
MPIIQVNDTLRNVIKEERKKRGIQGNVLAKDINKSASYISQIESGSINSMDVSVLYAIFKSIINLPEEDIFDYLMSLIDVNKIKLSSQDIEQKEWLINLEYQFRLFPMTTQIIDFLNTKLSELNITTRQLGELINSNEDVPTETLTKLKDNKVWVQVYEDGRIHTAIKFVFKENYIDDILNNKIKSINKINMRGILYNICKIEKMSSTDALFKADQYLKEFKFFTLEERNKWVKKSKSENIDLDTLILKEDSDCNKYIIQIIKHFATLRDFNCPYGLDVFSNMSKSLVENKSLTYALMKLEYFKLKDLSNARKKEFIDDVGQLIDKYSKPKEEDFLL